MGIKNRNSNKD